MLKLMRVGFLCLFALETSFACAASPAPQKATMLFAAASMRNALDEAMALFQKAHRGVEIKASYAASMTLARQIAAGAPADIFVSADVASMDYLAARDLIKPETRFDLLGNSLVVVAPSDSPLNSLAFTEEAFFVALGSGRLAIGDPASVPAGKYAKAAFEKLGLWSALEPRFAYAENVRSALVFVARKEAPLGVVYATDAKSEPKVKIVATFAEGAHPKIVYPIALTQAASGDTPTRFIKFLKGPQAKAVFLRNGFSVLAR
jgi:molybdate transport system substrate-binding protein